MGANSKTSTLPTSTSLRISAERPNLGSIHWAAVLAGPLVAPSCLSPDSSNENTTGLASAPRTGRFQIEARCSASCARPRVPSMIRRTLSIAVARIRG